MSTQPNNFDLQRDAFGQLVLTDGDGQRHMDVQPVRAFPLSAPDEGLSLVGTDGRECLWIERLDALPAAQRELLTQALAPRDFTPQLLRIHRVSTFGVPSRWDVETDRGPTTLVLKAEEDIRRLPEGALLIASAAGVQFRIDALRRLDAQSRRWLERFL